MVLRMIVGLVLTVAAFAIAGRRVWWLKRLAFSGQPAPERLACACARTPAADAETQLTEVVGQRKLLKWSVPGAAHAATFWGFIVLLLTIIEAYGDLFSRTFAIPGIGHWAAIGFLEDLFSVGVLCGLITFTVIRLRSDPHKEGRRSRFFGSHTSAAWVVLAMIALVIITLLLYRGAQQNTGVFPYPHAWAFASWVVGKALHPLGYGVNSVLEVVFLLAQLGVVHGVPGGASPTPSTCTSSSPRSTSCSPAARTPSARSSRCGRTGRSSTSRRPTRTPTCSASARSRT